MTKQEFLKDFGENLEYELNSSRTSRKELADVLGVSTMTIGRYIRGEQNPSVITLKLIAQTLCCEIKDLIDIYEEITD